MDISYVFIKSNYVRTQPSIFHTVSFDTRQNPDTLDIVAADDPSSDKTGSALFCLAAEYKFEHPASFVAEYMELWYLAIQRHTCTQ